MGAYEDQTARQFADAIGKAMARPRLEATVYSEADRRAVAADAARLRGKANRLLASVGPVEVVDGTVGPVGGATDDD